MIPVYLLTNDHHLWLLRGFSYLWNTFYSAEYPVEVYGYNPPGFNLPPNFRFHSLGNVNAPASQWSDSLIEMLGRIGHRWLILMLEDYWLTEPVDVRGVYKLWNVVMKDRDDILRLDLSGNRASYKRAWVAGQVDRWQIVETPPGTKYQMSFQAAIWDKDGLMRVLRCGETPWQAEVEGSKRVDLRVVGTRPAVMHYRPVWRTRTRTLDVSKIPAEQRRQLEQRGCLTPP